MGKEIERKFLIKNENFKKLTTGVLCIQGFLSTTKERVVRIRVMGEKAYLTIKGISKGATRTEFEYEIPVKDAEKMLLEMCLKPIIKKYRYHINYKGNIWEVDEFIEENKGLVIAEIEVQCEDDIIDIPSWVGKEVTGNPRYYNANLINLPFKDW
ncbi:MAG: CYTH domain-containing protein [Bacteroidales bacterium]|nr:CYTH domain-containing protein [Bacteroidales bacterium]